MERRTKIVITLGPASSDEETLTHLIKAGVNVVRLNFSHGTHAEHAAHFRRVRQLSAELNQPVTILQDLQGPKIRTGEIRGGAVTLKQGDRFTLTTDEVEGSEQRVSVDFEDLPNSVQTGGRILLDDGNLELVVVGIDGHEVFTNVVLGGVLKPNKGVNLPGIQLNVAALTEKDRQDLAFGLELGVDAVAMSFVRQPEDVVGLRNLINELRPGQPNQLPIIAKMERPEALKNLHEIVRVADGVMVARGDLGVEMSPEVVPIAQKQIIESANQHAKIVITATQMLDSMINNPRPTRAEATDVANAIFDGTDAVMLSGETAVGKFPVQVVETMTAIIRTAEEQLNRWGHWRGDVADSLAENHPEDGVHDDAISITRAASELAHDRNVAAIAIFTQTGRTAKLVAKTRPHVPILAFTPEETTYRQLPMLWGVIPYLVPYAETMEAMLEEVEQALITATPLGPGQQVVFISGFPVGAMRQPNLALLYTLGENKK